MQQSKMKPQPRSEEVRECFFRGYHVTDAYRINKRSIGRTRIGGEYYATEYLKRLEA